MGPEGEDALFDFLKGNFKLWQLALERFKPLADTGNYPGKNEIDDGLSLIKKLLALDSSYKFIEQFNNQKNDLLDLADEFHDLEHFYEHQKPTWEKLRKAYDKFQFNQIELEQDTAAGAALGRMREILSAPSPYDLIKDADALISTVSGVNSTLLNDRREKVRQKIDGHISTITKDLESAQANDDFRAECLKPLEKLRSRVETEESLAHISQAESDCLNAYDVAVGRIEEFVRKMSEAAVPSTGSQETSAIKPVLKKQRIVEPAKLMKTAYLETNEDVQLFIDELREKLEEAIANNERVQIR
jgi:hypothetical protein